MKRLGLAIIAIALTSLAAAGFNSAQADSGVKEIRMTAEYWHFTPSTINVGLGERVRIVITVVNNMMPMMQEQFSKHGFYIEGYNVSSVLPVGDTVTVEFVADKEGSFRFFCTIYCGMGHDEMKGTLVVGKNLDAKPSEPSRPGGMMPGGMGGMMQGMGGMMNMMGMGGMMPWGGWGWGFGIFWMILSTLLFLGLVALIAFAAYYLYRKSTTGSGSPNASRALQTLDERYAKGELTAEQYEDMKRRIRKSGR